MMRRCLLIPLVLLAACTEASTFPSGALTQPIDFAFACEGEGQTVAPQDDESIASYTATRMCPDINKGASTVQGALFGLTLSQSPPRVHVMQMNPASGHAVTILDADRFVPGYSGIPVGEAPVRLVRAADHSAFYVINAGSEDVTRLVIRSFDGLLDVAKDTFPLPGTPSNGFVTEGKLWVTAAFESKVWVLDTASMDSPPQIIALPDRIHSVVPLADGSFALTWKNRPVLSRMDALGTLDPAAEVGLVPACRDGLDNDGSGLIDHLDSGCQDAFDADEGVLPSDDDEPVEVEPLSPFVSSLFCDDGLDNDGDGLVDAQDPSCGPTGSGERVAECGDGIDNDGDGKIDTEDPACYSEAGLREGHVHGDGPFHASMVDSSAGSFVYVLDQSLGEILVFEVSETGFERIDVNAQPVTAPLIPYRAYGQTSETSLPAIVASDVPSLSRAGHKNIILPGPNLTSLSGFRGLGELWDRALAPAEGEAAASIAEGLSSSSHWIPMGCDPSQTDTCLQPDGDAENHFIVGSRLDGRLQLIQGVFRGVPWHRLVQSTHDPSLRSLTISQPKLSVAGDSILVGSAIPEGHPFMGPMTIETLQEGLSLTQANLRRQYGLWPPDEIERAPDETWALTYEGILPETEGFGGRVLGETLFYAPGKAFCSAGVQTGDWLVVDAAPTTLHVDLHYPIELTATGTKCPLAPIHTVRLQVAITSVGQHTLGIDPSTAHRVPLAPVLADSALSASQAKACGEVLDAARADLALAGGALPMMATDAFESGNLPDRLAYRVRTAHTWIAVGSRSGFLHGNVYAEGACAAEAGLDQEVHARFNEVTLAQATYLSCPPAAEDLAFDVVDELIDGDTRFANYSFKVDMFPACRNTDSGIVLPGTRRDTRWSFELDSPQSPQSIAVDGVTYSAKSVPFDFRRQLIHLGTSGNRVTVLKISPTSTVPISKFE